MSRTRTVVGWRGTSRRLLGLALAASLAACGEQPVQPQSPATLKVTVEGLANGAEIPTRFTCLGGGSAPVVKWSGDNRGAAAFAVVVDDRDATEGPFVHWIVLDLPGDALQLRSGSLPSQAVEAKNSAGGQGWTPPCPPSGTHHYRFMVYALSGVTNVTGGGDTEAALQEIQERVVAKGELVGTVTRQ